MPYFWSDQNRARIQFAGRHRDGDTVRITEGELSDGAPAEGGFPARYERDGTTAVVAVDRPCPFMRARRELARGAGEGRAQSALR
ncbi:oxidoreductase C-terminal domain-containing protein [Streptomyces luteogriseus]|uniref:oxidoreductase C-terminal domain-containing protein n=1 Tax=Streptomyces luteogriseus TaxID=68233 RepID=UPI003FA39469